MVSNLPTEYSCDIVLFQCAHPSNVYFSINYDKNCSNEITLTDLVNRVPFDDRINHEADITDLNITLIQSYLKEVGSSLYEESKTMEFLDLCKSMNIVNTLPEYTKPKNVGLMFFCLDPERFFPYAQIDVVQFPDGLGGDTIIEKIFKGPLHQQLREALLYISNTIVQERVQKLPEIAEAKRFFNYPYEAIEEALANAVYHKGYNEREPIEVRVLPDRIEIVSHPGADRSITMDGLKNYRVFNRRYRNRRIGEFLKELHLTEGRNTGFGKILRALEKNGSPKPLFETDDERTSFAATLFIHPGFIANGIDSGNNYGNENQFDNAERILKIMKDTPQITIDQIVSDTGISKRTVSRIIKELKEKDMIRREGTKNGTWIVLQ